jgi:hypothetical protein
MRLALCDNAFRCGLQLPRHQHSCWSLTQAMLKTSACGFHAHLKTHWPTLAAAKQLNEPMPAPDMALLKNEL